MVINPDSFFENSDVDSEGISYPKIDFGASGIDFPGMIFKHFSIYAQFNSSQY